MKVEDKEWLVRDQSQEDGACAGAERRSRLLTQWGRRQHPLVPRRQVATSSLCRLWNLTLLH